jgi:hypothetical protein
MKFDSRAPYNHLGHVYDANGMLVKHPQANARIKGPVFGDTETGVVAFRACNPDGSPTEGDDKGQDYIFETLPAPLLLKATPGSEDWFPRTGEEKFPP